MDAGKDIRANGQSELRNPYLSGFMRAFHLSHEVACLCDRGIIVDWNSAAPHLLGESTLHERAFADFVSPDFQPVIEALLCHNVEDSAPFPVHIHRRDGTTVHAELQVHPVLDLGPDLTLILARDISRQSQLARTALAIEQRFRHLVEHSMNLVVRCRGTTVEYINQAGLSMMGYGDGRRHGGWPVTDIFAPDYAALFQEAPDILLLENDMVPMQLLRQDGTLVQAQVKVTVFSAGDVPEYMLEARDIGPQNRAVAALREMNEQLERKVEERTLELSREKAALDREIMAGREMQFALLPAMGRLEAALERRTLSIHAHFEPSAGIGGDLWGCHELDDHRLLVTIFDFAGHGVRAALNTFRLHTLIAEYHSPDTDPASLLAQLGEALTGLLPPGHYATMLAMEIDTLNHRLTWAGAGAPRPVLTLPDGRSQWLETKGIPLGLVRRGAYGYTTHQTDFPPGSSVFLYSDAMLETPHADAEQFGDDRLIALVNRAARTRDAAGFERMLDEFRAQTGPVDDDLTAVMISMA